MDRILNDQCKFQCTGNPAIVISAKESENNIVKDGNKRVLTNKAKCYVSNPLPCPFLTAKAQGTPTPCNLNQGNWWNVNGKLKINGKSVLTDKSNTQCFEGGSIKPIFLKSRISKKQVRGVQDIALKSHEKERHNGESKSIGFKSNATDRVVNSNSNFREIEKNSMDTQGEFYSLDEKEETVFAPYCLCDYENCNRTSACRYFHTPILLENSSLKLSNNYKKERVLEWEEYYKRHQEKNKESNEGGWRIAAHHIISGNQILMMKDSKGELLYGSVVKLGNYFGYDVNNAINCIMLPTNENNFGEREFVHKIASAYEVMYLMGRQWHVGGHEYSLSKETLNNLKEYYRKNPDSYPIPGNPAFFSNYKMAMKEEMDKLLLGIRTQCWEKNFEKKKKKFLDRLNVLSRKVERYLLDFEENPRKSFPFFVSKVSVEYAYNLPATSKIVVIYQHKDEIRAKRVRIERYMKNELMIIPKEQEDMRIEDDVTFIKFCQNTMYFFKDIKCEYNLPFNISAEDNYSVREINLNESGVMNYMQNHGNEVIAFIQQNPNSYRAFGKVISLRLKGVQY